MSNPVTQEDSLSQFPTYVETIIRLALRLKWTGQWTSPQKQMLKLHSPNREVEINVPSTNVNANRAKSWINKIVRYSDPEDVHFEALLVTTGKSTPNTELMRAMAAATAKISPQPEPEPEPEPKSKTRRSGRKHGKSQITPAAMPKMRPPGNTVLPQPVVTKVDPDEIVEAEPTVVSSVPWLARAGGNRDGTGTMYESPHTLEQLMSDGTRRYKCKQCTYVSDNGTSVSVHGGKTHGANRTREPVKVTEYGEVEARNLKPRLLSDILGALDSINDWQSLSKEALASQVAALIIEARPDRTPAEPLTAEQMIERIRWMVDGERIGYMHDEVEQLRVKYAEAVDRAEVAEAEAEAAKAETDKVRGNLRALDSMIREVVGDEGTEAS